MTEKNESIAEHLQTQAEGRTPAKRMVFDPATGELVLVAPPPLSPAPVGTGLARVPVLDPDAVVIDQIAETGFFAREPASLLAHGIALTSVAAGGGAAGAGVGAGLGMVLAGPPGAAIGFLVGLGMGTVGGAATGNELGKRIGGSDSKGEER